MPPKVRSPRVVRWSYETFIRHGGWPGILEEAGKSAILQEVTTLRLEDIPSDKVREVTLSYRRFFGLSNPKTGGHEIELLGEEWDFPHLNTFIVRIKVKA